MNDALAALQPARRALMAALGIACAGLAGVGLIAPGMPATAFLVAASDLLAVRTVPPAAAGTHR